MTFPVSTFLVPKNNAESTLLSDITSSALSLTLISGGGSKFPSIFPFNITIDNEILQCSANANDVLTVTRAQEGTIAAAHVVGALVRLNITAKAIQDLNSAVNYMEIHWEDPISLNSGTLTIGQSGIYIIVQSGLGVVAQSGLQVVIQSGTPIIAQTVSGYEISIGPSIGVRTRAVLRVTANSGGTILASGNIHSVTVKAVSISADLYIGGVQGIDYPYSGYGLRLATSEAVTLDVANFNLVSVCATISGDQVSYIGVI